MAQTNHAIITVDNDEVRDVVVENFDNPRNGMDHYGVTVHVTGRNDEVHNKLEAISKKYPGETIRARHTLSINRHEKLYTLEYLNGESKIVKEEYNYIFEGFKAPKGYSVDEIGDLILDEFERVDNLSKAANKDKRLKKIKGGINSNADLVLIDMVKIDLEDIVVQATVENNLVKVRVWEKEVGLKEVI